MPTPRPLSVGELATGLRARAAERPPRPGALIIGIDGRSGSGKTSLATALAPLLGAPCVHLDDLVAGWGGLAVSVRLAEAWVLRPLATGRPAGWRCWSWSKGGFGAWHPLPDTRLVVVEGCGAGAAALRPWMSALAWLEVDEPDRSRRLRSRSDWALYAPWADRWAEQEEALRAGDDVAGAADVIVSSLGEGRLQAVWS